MSTLIRVKVNSPLIEAPQLRAKMGEDSRRKAEKEFSIER